MKKQDVMVFFEKHLEIANYSDKSIRNYCSALGNFLITYKK